MKDGKVTGMDRLVGIIEGCHLLDSWPGVGDGVTRDVNPGM